MQLIWTDWRRTMVGSKKMEREEEEEEKINLVKHLVKDLVMA